MILYQYINIISRHACCLRYVSKLAAVNHLIPTHLRYVSLAAVSVLLESFPRFAWAMTSCRASCPLNLAMDLRVQSGSIGVGG